MIPHGTEGGYTNHGCRCPQCRAAKAEARRASRARGGRVEPEPTHCEVCGDPLSMAAHGGPARRFCSPACARRAQGKRCVCGASIDGRAQACHRCASRAAQARLHGELRATLERLWAEGASLREMAREVGWAPNSMGVYVCKHRDWFPYRYSPERVAAVRRGLEVWRERTVIERKVLSG